MNMICHSPELPAEAKVPDKTLLARETSGKEK
jgi:hypothetical protein